MSSIRAAPTKRSIEKSIHARDPLQGRNPPRGARPCPMKDLDPTMVSIRTKDHGERDQNLGAGHHPQSIVTRAILKPTGKSIRKGNRAGDPIRERDPPRQAENLARNSTTRGLDRPLRLAPPRVTELRPQANRTRTRVWN
jgi:hypothetical protein